MAIAGCGQDISTKPSPLTLSGKTMGTTYSVKVARPPDSLDADALKTAIEAQLDRIDGQMSTYRTDSELSRFNRCEPNQWFTVSAETVAVVQQALRIGHLTDGAFDVTVGPLVDRWNFGPVKQQMPDVPSDREIEELKRRIGHDHLQVRPSPPALRRDHELLSVDLSGIAKGYAVDRVAELLGEQEINDYMVEIGGEIRAKGRNAQGKAWRIAIEAPVPEIRAIHRVVALKDLAMATSGDYRNFFEQNETRYSHIIDPRSGRPISHNLVSATVLTPTCAEADALATALMVLGPDAAYNLAVREDLPVLLLVATDDGLRERASPRFEKLFPP